MLVKVKKEKMVYKNTLPVGTFGEVKVTNSKLKNMLPHDVLTVRLENTNEGLRDLILTYQEFQDHFEICH